MLEYIIEEGRKAKYVDLLDIIVGIPWEEFVYLQNRDIMAIFVVEDVVNTRRK